jgi:hypothetical protein
MIPRFHRDALIGLLVLILMTGSVLGQENGTQPGEPKSKPPVEVVHRPKTDGREGRNDRDRGSDDRDKDREQGDRHRDERDERGDARQPSQNP